ncbi:hypothetical protein PC117_g945 [Phytophthora cactorum]|uniref:Reverse transcriptase domain-containing protein n=2 Tax=Phytophthora cactorum TaxID=29920 RepID=A0A8T1EMY5_9STRA|nr:hypothetical protein PC117_g945 [Phytophthora cactorum]
MPVTKPGSRDQFRLTIDFRPLNRVTIPIADSMPTASTTTDAFSGKNREIISFITEDGVFTPKRVPQGATDSALHFQGELRKVLAAHIPHSALAWVDDVILFAPTVVEFVLFPRQFFSLVAEARIKLNMAKSKLLEVEVLWCGRLTSGDGVRSDPARVSAIYTVPLPTTVTDLQYFICTTNWLQNPLPDYARMIAPLQTKLATEKKRIGGRIRNALAAAEAWTDPERGPTRP